MVGMGADIAEAFPAAAELFERANAIVGFDLREICFAGPADRLNSTTVSQPADASTEESGVPKNADAKYFDSTGSPSTGAMRGSISTHSEPGSSTARAGIFSRKTAAACLPKSS